MLKNVQQFFGFNLEDGDSEEEELLDLSFNGAQSASPAEKQTIQAVPSKVMEKKRATVSEQKKVIPGLSVNEIKIATPVAYDESIQIAAELREGTPIIVKCERLNADDSKRLIDFLCGTSYAINGQTEKISDKIFLFTPETTVVTHHDSEEYIPGTQETTYIQNGTGSQQAHSLNTPNTTVNHSPNQALNTQTTLHTPASQPAATTIPNQNSYSTPYSSTPNTQYGGTSTQHSSSQIATPYASPESNTPNDSTTSNTGINTQNYSNSSW